MRIAVIGSGAVGCFYGARLARAGHDVHFLMRRDYQAVRARGLTIKSCEGDFHVDAQAYDSPDRIGPADLVICALKTTAIDAAETLIKPCVGEHSQIIALMNGLGVEERFGNWFGPERIIGGLAFVCINRGEPGVVHHKGYGRVTFGHLLDDVAKARWIAELFTAAGVETYVAERLLQARWEKLVWNIPFNSLEISAGGVSTPRILANAGLRGLAETLMEETVAAGNADGCSIVAEPLIARMFANTETMGHYKTSMLIDYEQRRPLEVESILGEPVRRAQTAGVAVPCALTQYHLIRFLDRLNRGEMTRYD